ncbi:unnamed protein product [Blepharisma stoltei]|uniref:Uncharacterized protein n=1 Tax=Blepharisma stoltei TaxID=1481888 RepID=A0AAU9JQS2_9CILI|nr:unnamed protein product [Blepharisma stoltei]
MKSKSSKPASSTYRSFDNEDITTPIKSARHIMTWREAKKNANLSNLKIPQGKYSGAQLIKNAKEELSELGKYLLNTNTTDVSYLKDTIKSSKALLQPITIFPTDIKTLEKFLEGMDICESPRPPGNHQLINQALCKKENCIDHLLVNNPSEGNLKKNLQGSPFAPEKHIEITERYDLGNPSGRQEVSNLKNWLSAMKSRYLTNFESENDSSIEEIKSAELIFTTCQRELVRQVSVYCLDRGELLEEVFKGFQKIFKQKEKIHEKSFENSKEEAKIEQDKREEQFNAQMTKSVNYIKFLSEKIANLKENKKGVKKDFDFVTKEYDNLKAKYDKEAAEWKKKEMKLRKEIGKLKENFIKHVDEKLKFETTDEDTRETPIERENLIINRSFRFGGEDIKNVNKAYRHMLETVEKVDQEVQVMIPETKIEVPEQKHEIIKIVEIVKEVVKKEAIKVVTKNRYTQTGFIENLVQNIPEEAAEISSSNANETFISDDKEDIVAPTIEIIPNNVPETPKINENSQKAPEITKIESSETSAVQEAPANTYSESSEPPKNEQKLLNLKSIKEKAQKPVKIRRKSGMLAIPNTSELDTQKNRANSTKPIKSSKTLSKKKNGESDLQQSRNSIDFSENEETLENLESEISKKREELYQLAKEVSQNKEILEKNNESSKVDINSARKTSIPSLDIKKKKDRQNKNKGTFSTPNTSRSIKEQQSKEENTPIREKAPEIYVQEKLEVEEEISLKKKNSKNRSISQSNLAKISLEKSVSSPISADQSPKIPFKSSRTLKELSPQNPNLLLRSYSITSSKELEEERIDIVNIIPPNADSPSWTLGYQAGYELGKREGFKEGEAFGIEEGQINGYLKAAREYTNNSRPSQLDVSDEAYWETDPQSESEGEFKEKSESEEGSAAKTERRHREKHRRRAENTMKSQIKKSGTEALEKLQENQSEDSGEEGDLSSDSEKYTIESEEDEGEEENKEIDKEEDLKSPGRTERRESMEKRKIKEYTKFAEFHFHKRENKKIRKKMPSSTNLLKKFLSRTMKWILRKATMSRRMVNKIMSSFYTSCFSSHLDNSHSVIDYLYNDMSDKYTLKKITDRKFLEFIASVLRSSDSKRSLMFLKFTGVSKKLSLQGYSMFSFQFYLKSLSFMQKAKIGINSSFDETADIIYMPTVRAIECIKDKLDGVVEKSSISKLISQVEQASIQDPLKINATGLIEEEYVLELMVELYEEYIAKIQKGIDEVIFAIKYNENKDSISKQEFFMIIRHISPMKFYILQKEEEMSIGNSMSIIELTSKCIEKGLLAINDVKSYCQINEDCTKEDVMEEIKVSIEDMKNIAYKIDDLEEKNILNREEWERKMINCESGIEGQEVRFTKLAWKLYQDELIRLKSLIKE